MSAFQPISPRVALQVLANADTGLDCARLLADLAEAGLVKGYAKLVETNSPGQPPAEVRGGRIDRATWKRIVVEDKVEDIYAHGSVRLGGEAHPNGSVSVLGISFDEKSVRAAALEYGRTPEVAKRQVAAKPSPAPLESKSETAAALHKATKPRRPLAPDAIAASVSEAAAALGLGRVTIYKMMDRGTLDSKKVGGRRLISTESIRAVIAKTVAHGPAA